MPALMRLQRTTALKMLSATGIVAAVHLDRCDPASIVDNRVRFLQAMAKAIIDPILDVEIPLVPSGVCVQRTSLDESFPAARVAADVQALGVSCR